MWKLLQGIALSSILVVLLYVSPILWGGTISLESAYPKVFVNVDYQNSLIRSLLFAFFSTVIVILLSFFAGYVLRLVTQPKLLAIGSLLLIPFLLGNVSVSFLYKIILFDSEIIDAAFGNTYLLFSILIFTHLWQFGTLFTYVFWLNNLSTPRGLSDYCQFYEFTTFEKIKFAFLPKRRDLILLLSLFSFVSCFYESTKSQIIFRASKGTNSEMLSQRLYQAFTSDTLNSIEFASKNIYSQTLLFYFPLTLFLVFLLYVFFDRIIVFVYKAKFRFFEWKINMQLKKKIALILLMSMLLAIITPISYAYFIEDLVFQNLSPLLGSIILSLLAAVFLFIVISLTLSLVLRITWSSFFNNINGKSFWIFIGLFLLYLIPPISLMLCGFEWSAILDMKGELGVRFSWVVGQCINSLPLLATFLFVIHFNISNRELDYLSSMNVSRIEIVYWSFAKRFKVEYFMAFLFSFSIIWNEGTFNRVYSDRIPSYVSEILRTISSRNADYGKGMMYFTFSLFLALACILTWNIILNKTYKGGQNAAF